MLMLLLSGAPKKENENQEGTADPDLGQKALQERSFGKGRRGDVIRQASLRLCPPREKQLPSCLCPSKAWDQ